MARGEKEKTVQSKRSTRRTSKVDDNANDSPARDPPQKAVRKRPLKREASAPAPPAAVAVANADDPEPPVRRGRMATRSNKQISSDSQEPAPASKANSVSDGEPKAKIRSRAKPEPKPNLEVDEDVEVKSSVVAQVASTRRGPKKAQVPVRSRRSVVPVVVSQAVPASPPKKTQELKKLKVAARATRSRKPAVEEAEKEEEVETVPLKKSTGGGRGRGRPRKKAEEDNEVLAAAEEEEDVEEEEVVEEEVKKSPRRRAVRSKVVEEVASEVPQRRARATRALPKARRSPIKARSVRGKKPTAVKAIAAPLEDEHLDEEAGDHQVDLEEQEGKKTGVQIIVNFEAKRDDEIAEDSPGEHHVGKEEDEDDEEEDKEVEEKPQPKAFKSSTRPVKATRKTTRSRKVAEVEPVADDAEMREPVPQEVKPRTRKRRAPAEVEVNDIAEVPATIEDKPEDVQVLPPKRTRRGKADVQKEVPVANEAPRGRRTRKAKNQEEPQVATDEIHVLVGSALNDASHDKPVKSEIEEPVDEVCEVHPAVVGLVENMKEKVASFIESDSMIFDASTELFDEKFKSPEEGFRLSTQELTADFESTSHDDTMEMMEASIDPSSKTQDNQIVPASKKPRSKPLLTIVSLPNIRGKLMTFGDDTGGELGLGIIGLSKQRPELVEAVKEPVALVATGAMHTVCLTNSFSVYTFGCNDECALGRETASTEDSEAKPAKVPFPVKIVKITAGDSHTAVLTAHGCVYLMGNFRDQQGIIGLTPASKDSVLDPMPVTFNVNFVDIASGSNHLLMLTENGQIYSAGVGEQGQLGRISEEDAKFKKERAELFLKPEKVKTKDNLFFEKIWAGQYVSFARSTEGHLYAWGLNNYCQLGFKSPDSSQVEYFPKLIPNFSKTEVQDVCSGSHHTLALDKSGIVYSCGRHEYGRLGHGTTKSDEETMRAIEALKGKTVTSIACGPCSSFAVTNKGQLYSWGMESTNLGVGDEDLWEPTRVQSKSLRTRKVLSVTAGSQHTAIVVASDEENTNGN